MKNFKTVQVWLDSEPAAETIEIVLRYINISAVAEYKRELSKKEGELKRLESAISSMEEIKLAVPGNLTDTAKALRKRIYELAHKIPPQRKLNT